MEDLAHHGFTAGCTRRADLELGRVDSKKKHNGECRARMYGKLGAEKYEKYAKDRTERERAARENLPMPNFVDLDAADYDRWLPRESTKNHEPAE